jgi:hypothetical protein
MLVRLDMTLLGIACAAAIGGGVEAAVVVTGRAGGVPVLGVSVIRSVLGCTVLFRGEPVAAAVRGVPGRELKDVPLVDGAREGLFGASGLELADGAGEPFSFSFAAVGVVSILMFPGRGCFAADVSGFC